MNPWKTKIDYILKDDTRNKFTNARFVTLAYCIKMLDNIKTVKILRTKKYLILEG